MVYCLKDLNNEYVYPPCVLWCEASIQSDPTDRDINNYLHLTQQIMNGKDHIHASNTQG